MLQAIVFDFDGTIVDTETPDYQTWQEIYSSYDVALPLDLWLQCVGGGTGSFDPHDHLETELGRAIDRQRLRTERRRRFLDRVHAQPVLPGVPELIAAAQRRGLKLAVASSSDRNWVDSHLQRLGLRALFDAVVTADDVERVKPDPALYRVAVKRLDVPPRRALAIEDSYNGMLGAKGAGLHCIAVPNRVTRSSDFSAADLQLDSIASIAAEELIDRFNDAPVGAANGSSAGVKEAP